MPKEDSPTPQKADSSKEHPVGEPKQEAQIAPEETTSAPHKTARSTPSGTAFKQTYPLYPSVQHLLELNGLPREEANEIPATGPSGRLLKGDVLAYVGKIQESYPSELADRFRKLSLLDLSNVKVAEKKDAHATPAVSADVPIAVEELDVEVILPISLAAVMECQKRVKDSIGVFLPLSTFIARATELANEDLPKSRTAKPSSDELFNAVLGLDRIRSQKISRGRFVPQVTALTSAIGRNTHSSSSKKPDLLDVLAGKRSAVGAKQHSTPAVGMTTGPLNVFSISVPKGDEGRGRVFLERVKTVLEADPGRLVV